MKDRSAGIALAAGAATQLPVRPLLLMVGAADHQKSARGDHPGTRHIIGVFAAEPDICSASRHRRGDGHRARRAGARDDMRLAGMMFGVEQREGLFGNLAVRRGAALSPAVGFKQRSECFRAFDRRRADQNRLATRVCAFDLAQDGRAFVGGGGVKRRFVDTDQRAVSWNGNHIETVDVAIFDGVGDRGAGHAGKLGVTPEIGLEGGRGQRAGFLADRAAFLRFQRLMQSFIVASPRHRPPSQGIDNGDLTIVHDVVAITRQDDIRALVLHDMMQ